MLTISSSSPGEDGGESDTDVKISFRAGALARGSGVNRRETSSVDDRDTDSDTDAEADLGVSAMVSNYRKLLAKALDELDTIGEDRVRTHAQTQIKELIQKLEVSRAGVEPGYVRPSAAELRTALGPAPSRAAPETRTATVRLEDRAPLEVRLNGSSPFLEVKIHTRHVDGGGGSGDSVPRLTVAHPLTKPSSPREP